RRGVAPYVERQKVTAVRVYDRRLRWPVPTDLPHRLIGRTVDRIDRRSKYLLFRLGADTLIVHMGMTGSLRGFTATRRDSAQCFGLQVHRHRIPCWPNSASSLFPRSSTAIIYTRLRVAAAPRSS